MAKLLVCLPGFPTSWRRRELYDHDDGKPRSDRRVGCSTHLLHVDGQAPLQSGHDDASGQS